MGVEPVSRGKSQEGAVRLLHSAMRKDHGYATPEFAAYCGWCAENGRRWTWRGFGKWKREQRRRGQLELALT